MGAQIIIANNLPGQKIKNIRFLYIVIDSELKVHYEFNNKGHVVLPIHWSELNPLMIYRNLPRNLIQKSVSGRKNIVGVLQLWIYYTKDQSYARIKAIGLLETFQGNRIAALLRLLKAMDGFCKAYQVSFVEAETSVVPENVMRHLGFIPAASQSRWRRLEHFLTRQRGYVKGY
ncbi:MAG: hypothetical protein AABX13_00590 [Nanoarchaeota archaeon]